MMNTSSTQQYWYDYSPSRKLTGWVINPILRVFLSIVFLILLGIAPGNAQTITFTGDAEADFSGDGVFLLEDSVDVGVPPGWPFLFSGWDIKTAYFFTNLNQLFIGIDYFGIAGDADGDGDPNNSSAALTQRGGQDLPNMGSSESFQVEIDIDQDGTFDIIAGVPGGDPPGFPSLGCANFNLSDCFGTYNHTGSTGIEFGRYFASLIDGTNTLFASPSATAPDIEFTIDWGIISEIDEVELNSCETFSFNVSIFSGSFQDDGIGEDIAPNTSNSATVTLEVCADCEGALFGTKKLDLCGVCGGDNSTCGAKIIPFTGDPESDFSGNGVIALIEENFDVGLPPQFPFSASGWDIKTAYFFTNLNQLFIGIDYFGIAGDADGDGDPDSASSALTERGGQDLPNMENTESLAVEIDLDQDGVFDVVAGVPGGDPNESSLDCPTFNLTDCFGLYNHTGNSSEFGRNFESLIDPINTLFALPSSDTPDIEFTIENWDMISGWEALEPDTCGSFSFDVRLYSGSFQDDGIGEDFLPNASNALSVTFEVCADCAGFAFGTNEMDKCGICNGDNSTCLDCLGIPNGGTEFDECGVCGGDNSSCLDCAGIPNGDTEVDECGVCGGDNSSCLDCSGIPNGDAEIDECNVCGGDNSTCLDCAGIPNGPNFINICGECSDSNPPFCNPVIPNPTPMPTPIPTPSPTPEPDVFNMVQIADVTITSPEETVISGAAQIVALCEKEIDGDTHDYPHEFFAYTVGGISAGEAIQVEYTFPNGSGPFDKFFMFGPTPDNPEPHCYEFTFDGMTGAQIMEDGRVVLTIVDGGRGDSDLVADGIITDPGGPAVVLSSAVEADNNGNGGCALSGTSDSMPSFVLNLLIPLLLGLFVGARRIITAVRID